MWVGCRKVEWKCRGLLQGSGVLNAMKRGGDAYGDGLDQPVPQPKRAVERDLDMLQASQLLKATLAAGESAQAKLLTCRKPIFQQFSCKKRGFLLNFSNYSINVQ